MSLHQTDLVFVYHPKSGQFASTRGPSMDTHHKDVVKGIAGCERIEEPEYVRRQHAGEFVSGWVNHDRTGFTIYRLGPTEPIDVRLERFLHVLTHPAVLADLGSSNPIVTVSATRFGAYKDLLDPAKAREALERYATAQHSL